MIISEQERGNPVRGLQTMLRRISQAVGDIPLVVPDGIYGDNTKASVTAFQISYGLPPTGETDAETWDRIREVYIRLQTIYQKPAELAVISENLRIMPGEQNAELWIVQSMLKALAQVLSNMPDLELSGVHAPDSVAATLVVQEVSGLEKTGVIDVITGNKITGLYRSNILNQPASII